MTSAIYDGHLYCINFHQSLSLKQNGRRITTPGNQPSKFQSRVRRLTLIESD
jgi:hypothetical protein